MEVCVVGAGVGGLALANGLLADGHAVQVLERACAPSAQGAAVTIYSNGAAALARLGVQIDHLGGALHRLVLHQSNGRRLLSFDLDVLEAATGYGVRSVPRAELIEALSGGLGAGTVRYQQTVRSVRLGEHGSIEVRTDGEDLITPGVLVGADGYRSVVRQSLLGGPEARTVGWVTWQGLSTVVPELTAGGDGWLMVGPAGLVGILPAGAGRTQWWFDTPCDPDAPPSPRPMAWLRREFASYAEPVPTLLAAIGETDLGRYPHVLHDVPDRWGSGAVTLLGDAAHAFPPSQAQGANQAIEDAWLLRRALSSDGDVAESLRHYERTRTRRVRVVSRLAASERTNRAPSAGLALLTRLTPTGLASRGYLRMIRRFSSVLNDEGE